MLFQRSLWLSSFFFFSFFFIYSVLWQWFPLFCSPGHLSFLCLSYSAIDSFQDVVHLCLFFSSSRSLVNISCIFLIFASILFSRSWIIFTVIILNSSSGRLHIVTSFGCFSGVLSYPFIWYKTLCSFTLLYFLSCGFVSSHCGIVVLLASSVCPLVDEANRLVWAFWWEELVVRKTGSCSGGQGLPAQ